MELVQTSPVQGFLANPDDSEQQRSLMKGDSF